MTVEYDISLNFRGNDALKQVDRIQTKVNQVDQSAQRLTGSMNKMALAVKAAVGSAALAAVIKYSDEWKQLENKLIDVVGAGDQATDILIELNNVAIASAQDVGGVVEVYSSIADTLNDLGFTANEQIGITESFANALLAGGNSAQQNASLINAYTKAVNEGKLAGEQFNTIVSLGGPLLRALKKEMADVTGTAKVTTEQLKALTTAGDVKALNLANALKNSRIEMEKLAGQVELTVSQSYTQLTNAITQQIGVLDDAAGGTRALANTFSFLAENMDTVFDVAEAVAVLFSGRMAAAIGTYTASIIAGNSATKALTTTVGGLSAVVFENGVAIDKQTGSVIFGRREADKAAIAQLGLQKAYAQQAVSATAASAAIDRYGASTAVYAKATQGAARKTDLLTKASSGAVKAASGLFSLLGGLPGILLSAGFAIALYGDKLIGMSEVSDIASVRQEGLRENIEKQERAVDKLNKAMTELIKTGKKNTDEYKKLERTMKSLTEVGSILGDELDDMAKDTQGNLKAATDEVTRLEGELVKVIARRTELSQVAVPGSQDRIISLLQQEGRITEELTKRRIEVEKYTKAFEEEADKRVSIATNETRELDRTYNNFVTNLLIRLRQTSEDVAQYDNRLIPEANSSEFERQYISIVNSIVESNLAIQRDLENTTRDIGRQFDAQIELIRKSNAKRLKGLQETSDEYKAIQRQERFDIERIEEDKAAALELIADNARTRELVAEREHTAELVQLRLDRAKDVADLKKELSNRRIDDEIEARQREIDAKRQASEDTTGGSGFLADIINVTGGRGDVPDFTQQREGQALDEDQATLDESERYRAELDALQAFYEEKATIFSDNEAILAELEIQKQAEKEAALMTHEENLTSIEEDGARARQEIALLEAQTKAAAINSFADSAISIMKSFGKKTAKAEKAVAIVRSGMAITSGVAQALNNPYPANLGFAASVAAQGASLLSKLKSFNTSGSGGSATAPTVNTSTPSTTVASTPQQNEATGGQQTIILQNDIADNDIITGSVFNQLVEQLQQQIEDGGNIGRIIRGDQI